MKRIAKTLLLNPSPEKLEIYQKYFYEFFAPRDIIFKEIVDILSDFFRQFKCFATVTVVEHELKSTHKFSTLKYIEDVLADANESILGTDQEFFFYLKTLKARMFDEDIRQTISRYSEGTLGKRHKLSDIRQELGKMLAGLHDAEARAFAGEAGASHLLFGQEAVDGARKDYKQTPPPEYPLPYRELSYVLMRPGDLVFVGAYTSEGKSAMLRALAYNLAVEHGLNVLFVTLETSADEVRNMFGLLHANNPKIFPDTPEIPTATLRTRNLSDEQEDFFSESVLPDLFKNPAYGTIVVEQPSAAHFTLEELSRLLTRVAQDTMPIPVLVIDYVTYMHPVSPGRMLPPQLADYNELIKQVKRLCVTHRNADGEKAPILCLTAAQVSRRAYAEALKREAENNDSLHNNGPYGLDAFSTYTEIERSADIAITTFMPESLRISRRMKVQVQKNRIGPKRSQPVTLFFEAELGMTIVDEAENSAQRRNDALEAVFNSL